MKLTRGELAAIIARLLNGGLTTLKADCKDIPSVHWGKASSCIQIVTDIGIFKGFAERYLPRIQIHSNETQKAYLA